MLPHSQSVGLLLYPVNNIIVCMTSDVWFALDTVYSFGWTQLIIRELKV